MSLVPWLIEQISAIYPAQWCQAFFILGAAAVLAIQIIPKSSRGFLLNYGARGPKAPGYEEPGTRPAHWFDSLVQQVSSIGQVPHSWFIHFYIASVTSSVFWASQFLRNGVVMSYLAGLQEKSPSPSADLDQVLLAWTLMCFQGGRRLYECLAIMKPSSSKMWFVHWLLGVSFYLCMSISVWVEGAESILHQKSKTAGLLTAQKLLSVSVFVIASLKQYEYHKYLASLKKYSLPDKGMFQYVVCPHYTCECLVYLSMAIAAAPRGQWFNQTLLCGFWFIVANLGTTANGTKQWYGEKFGPGLVAGRWKMIPFIF